MAVKLTNLAKVLLVLAPALAGLLALAMAIGTQ